ncbi:MAG: undecaprenyl/decaprenyl-phosphate alpha-N-acetylglucosaminyl 1-phosphate transferase [Planctomycetes bacterium]|nr:undecaprenyl/decaprenyl-phosphate alpha-N-acetylglucosaminyl 1-phosphate transferase [Planctomycetota bacterium]
MSPFALISSRDLDALVVAGALFVAATLATALLVACAPRLGLVDDASDAPLRKLHRRAVPLVGGSVLALVLGAWVLVRGVEVVGGALVGGIAFDPRAVLVACALAFVTGLVDDMARKGLGPLAKLVGQTAAGIALARGLQLDGESAALLPQALAVFCAVLAQNAANTFDNADGALCAVASAGLVLATPFAGATLAFLPWNLLRARGSHTPRAWLGDSGSHLLGILLLTTPVAWGALILPVADLARVVAVRLRAGDPIWRGDRRHLAHALEARGHGPARVALLLVLAALPGVALARYWPG